MEFQYSKHYTREEARELLPQIRGWLKQLNEQRTVWAADDQNLGQQLARGFDLGGPLVNRWLQTLLRIKEVLSEFERREIQIKDVERGLIDFPAFVAGREVFLCWELDEEDVEFWHDLNSGYAGREPL